MSGRPPSEERAAPGPARRLKALAGTTALVVTTGVVAALALGALITVIALTVFDALA